MKTLNFKTVSTKLQRIAELARKAPMMVFTTLAHNINHEFLKEAHRRTRKNAATGIDGQTAKEYLKNLDKNLESLLNRFKSGKYRAPAVRRVYIPKGDTGKMRPIGVPTFEDKVLQRAVSMVLEAVYEQDFLNCSYGFRQRRSAHQALQTLGNGIMEMKGGYVLEIDIKNYFDTISREHLRNFLRQRMRDGVISRTIGKWLKAGVLEEGIIRQVDSGTPQGGVISPILANIYLHEVMDVWFEKVIKPRLQGTAMLIRYADDAVMVFSDQEDAKRIMKVLPKRMGKYGLTLNLEKTQLVTFRRPLLKQQGKQGKSFDFLGFTHYWGRSRKKKWIIKKKTAKNRLNRILKNINSWCREYRHAAVEWQRNKLELKIKGHYGYFGITGNIRSLMKFYRRTIQIWKKWLSRRSQKGWISWEQFYRLIKQHPLPPPRIVHSYVTQQTILLKSRMP